MNRRDIIVIAVLINAGLLVVLFTSALKSDRDEPVLSKVTELPLYPQGSSQGIVNTKGSQMARGDEVDLVLSQFAGASNSFPSSAAESSSGAPLLQPVAVMQPEGDARLVQDPFVGPPPAELPGLAHTSKGSFHSAAAPSSIKEIRVKKGDALEKIARAHHTSVQEIMRINKLSSTQLKIGQVLKIPSKASEIGGRGAPRPKEATYYTVKNGDSPWAIATKNQIKLEELLELNGLSEEKARKLQPGDQIRIR